MPDTHDTGNHWNPALHEQIFRYDLHVDDVLFDDPPAYSPTSPADSAERMDMEEYDSAMTDMLMSIGVDKLSATQLMGKSSKKPDASVLRSTAEAQFSVKQTRLVDRLTSRVYVS